ncbi:LysM peptidoglycan-binding domain-containing protein [Alicyclobacillus pomorum]|uniref:LysM peptidoglycan-binding domain-containing protein n=1 Tax=Alicyclobacillus pomorum TaxID=204470 RepID=UPI000404A5CF|nr:LysM domain-containing protein [Alicyclobacillus pomorum]
MKKYIVRDGDTMWTISKETGVRLNLLMAANPQVTDPNRLRPGNVIVIPELYKKTETKPSGEPSRPPTQPAPAGAVPPYFGFVWPHVVKAGETWESIAAGYNASVAQLKELNPSQPEGRVREGQVIYVPGVTSQGTPTPGSETQAMPSPTGQPYGAPDQYPPEDMQPWPPETFGSGAQPYHPPTGYPPNAMPYPPGGMYPGPGVMPQQGTVPQPGFEPYGPHTHYPYRTRKAPKLIPGANMVRPAYSGYWAFIPYQPHLYGMPPVPMAPSPPMHLPAAWYSDGNDSSSSWRGGEDSDWTVMEWEESVASQENRASRSHVEKAHDESRETQRDSD